MKYIPHRLCDLLSFAPKAEPTTINVTMLTLKILWFPRWRHSREYGYIIIHKNIMINENNYNEKRQSPSVRMFMRYAVAHKFSYQKGGCSQKLTKAWDVLCAITYRWDTLWYSLSNLKLIQISFSLPVPSGESYRTLLMVNQHCFM